MIIFGHSHKEWVRIFHKWKWMIGSYLIAFILGAIIF
jgi:hypothetical protein